MRVTSLLAVLAALALSTALLLGAAIAEPQRLPAIWCINSDRARGIIDWQDQHGSYIMRVRSSQYGRYEELIAVPDGAAASFLIMLMLSTDGWTCKVESR